MSVAWCDVEDGPATEGLDGAGTLGLAKVEARGVLRVYVSCVGVMLYDEGLEVEVRVEGGYDGEIANGDVDEVESEADTDSETGPVCVCAGGMEAAPDTGGRVLLGGRAGVSEAACPEPSMLMLTLPLLFGEARSISA